MRLAPQLPISEGFPASGIARPPAPASGSSRLLRGTDRAEFSGFGNERLVMRQIALRLRRVLDPELVSKGTHHLGADDVERRGVTKFIAETIMEIRHGMQLAIEVAKDLHGGVNPRGVTSLVRTLQRRPIGSNGVSCPNEVSTARSSRVGR